ncbi:Ankyrin-2 [Trichoplax sp. H2]|nr:Ankyrin-2 [Trichoplax sp. H2]|eukprot:RDD43145.1 Ankyrin-2 [Trichoplax sp. H2]
MAIEMEVQEQDIIELFEAAEKGDGDTLLDVINGLNPNVIHNSPLQDGKPLLIHCIQNTKEDGYSTHFRCCEFILSAGFDINDYDSYGRTALHWSILLDKTGITQFLIDGGAKVDAYDRDGYTPLHLAIQNDNHRSVHLLCQVDPKVCETPAKSGLTPLMQAVQRNNFNICRTLLEAGASPNSFMPKNKTVTPILTAVELQYRHILSLLLSHGGNPFAADRDGIVVVRAATTIETTECLQLLIERYGKSVTEISDKQGTNPLMWACQAGNHDHATILLENEVDPTLTDRDGKNAVHWSCYQTRSSCVKLLAKVNKSLVHVRDKLGRTPLHYACMKGSNGIVKSLLRFGADVNALDDESRTPMHWATVTSNVTGINCLIKAGAKLDQSDLHQAYPLHYAAQMEENENNVAVLTTLLDNKAPSLPDRDQRHPLLWAAGAGNAKACVLLVKHGCDVETADVDGLTALHTAASKGHLNCVQSLLRNCNSSVDSEDHDGNTPLFYAISHHHLNCIQFLLDNYSSPYKQNKDGRCAAHCAAALGSAATLKLLSRYNNAIETPNRNGDYPLHEAVLAGKLDAANYLIKRGCDVNITNKEGATPLHYAASINHTALTKILLEANADPTLTMKNKDGHFVTPVQIAHSHGKSGSSCLKLLLKAKGNSIRSNFIMDKAKEEDEANTVNNHDLPPKLPSNKSHELVLQPKRTFRNRPNSTKDGDPIYWVKTGELGLSLGATNGDIKADENRKSSYMQSSSVEIRQHSSSVTSAIEAKAEVATTIVKDSSDNIHPTAAPIMRMKKNNLVHQKEQVSRYVQRRRHCVKWKDDSFSDQEQPNDSLPQPAQNNDLKNNEPVSELSQLMQELTNDFDDYNDDEDSPALRQVHQLAKAQTQLLCSVLEEEKRKMEEKVQRLSRNAALIEAAAQTVSVKLQNKYDKILDEVDQKMKQVHHALQKTINEVGAESQHLEEYLQNGGYQNPPVVQQWLQNKPPGKINDTYPAKMSRKQRKNEKLLALKKLVVDEDDWAKLSTFERRKQYSNTLKNKNSSSRSRSRPSTGLISGSIPHSFNRDSYDKIIPARISSFRNQSIYSPMPYVDADELQLLTIPNYSKAANRNYRSKSALPKPKQHSALSTRSAKGPTTKSIL